MEEQIKKFISDIKLREFTIADEATTKQIIILRLFSILDWNIYNPDEVYPEYQVGGGRVDYSLRNKSQNKVFVEVKRVDEDLEAHREQLLNYAFREGIKIAVLTNGLSWWFYLPLEPGSWEQRKFFSIDLLEQEENEVIKNFIDFLSKESVITDKAIDVAKSLYDSNKKMKIISTSLPKAWNKLIQETDEKLTELVNDINEKICGHRATDEQIAEFLDDNKERLILVLDNKQTEETKNQNHRRYSKNSEYVPTGYTKKKPSSLVIDGKKYYVKKWTEVLILVCEFLLKTHPNEFEQKISGLRRRTGPYISKNENVLKEPIRIPNSPYFVERQLNANRMFELSRQLMALFGHDSNLHIEIR